MTATQPTTGGAPDAARTGTLEGPSLLEQAISATKQTERNRAEELLRTLTEEALSGTVVYDRNLTATLNKAIAAIDAKVSRQLAAIMHHPSFTKLEGSWRGLHHLVMNSETGTTLRIKVLNVSKRDLFKDLDRAVEFDQSQVYKKIYENEFGLSGGEPYGALIGDYEFTNHPEDIQLLSNMSSVAASAFAPFITAAAPGMLGLDDYRELAKPRDLAKIFDTVEYAKWRSFRESEDSRFVVLTMPRVLARLPYGAATKPVEEFAYEEAPSDADGRPLPMEHADYCWMNAAYVMGSRLTAAFAKSGFCTAIRGRDNGGKVEGLPGHIFVSDDGDMDQKCPTEIAITDRREAELSKLGFLPLCHYKNNDYAVFFGAQSVQKPKQYDRPEATANAEISARLPYVMATSRFAHYLKVMARDKIGSFMEASECEDWLNRWIMNYVNSAEGASAESKMKYPLRDARVEVREIPGKPGSYNAVAWLRPWLQMEELNASLRLVARVPERG
ncbi:type VI secretion system contractile sheath large subunit [Arenibaculum pallidiluteum]|uniref:type VI secretion system contractile sheath large subunit n=1 Tax=Arenibaculum pallidiluteum TaxID=2812559 RepID=UPI001A95CA32|nr:type VI secretion system contractile sheath large subunit [Arenibaculum pallidiluteum]